MIMDVIPDCSNMIDHLLGERERLAHQTTTPLPQRVVESLDMVRLSALLADGPMAFGRDDRRVGLPKVGVTDGTLPVHCWKRGPQLPRRRLGPPTNGDPDDFPRVAVDGKPDPDLPALFPDKRPQFITFQR